MNGLELVEVTFVGGPCDGRQEVLQRSEWGALPSSATFVGMSGRFAVGGDAPELIRWRYVLRADVGAAAVYDYADTEG